MIIENLIGRTIQKAEMKNEDDLLNEGSYLELILDNGNKVIISIDYDNIKINIQCGD